MPEIRIQHIVSCSSEDKNNPADNLKKPEGSHKWKSSTPGDKCASVVLQFEKSCQINSIDIGNEGSAFVEILVGKSSASSDQDYQVILVASSFMSPMESRNGTNRNSVRMFGSEKLSKTVAGEKWDRVKIVCTQPFNKTSTFGLSFIKFHSPSDDKEGEKTSSGQTTLGAFRLKSDAGDAIPVGSLFAHRKEKTEIPALKGAAAIRAASKLAEESKPSPMTSKPSPLISSHSAKASPVKRKHSVSSDEEAMVHAVKTPLRKQSTSVTSTPSSKHRIETPPLKKTKSEPVSSSKELSNLMDRVVFVISGFQNPYRGEIRDKAMQMGAKYQSDWSPTCTHLICAFANTPKYRQVKGKGIIVKKNWIIDCHKQKKLLPCRKYQLEAGDSDTDSSEEDDVVPVKPVTKQPAKRSDTGSDDDTDDEIRRAKKKVEEQEQKTSSQTSAVAAGENPYGDSTDEDDVNVVTMVTSKDESSDSGLPDLPDFFTDKVFMFYGEIPAQEKRLLTRYITAYDGTISDYMSSKINYVVTLQTWDQNFEDALSENSSLVFVKCKWIHLCHEKNKLLPYQPYVVVPT